jgi:hypothetical protein
MSKTMISVPTAELVAVLDALFTPGADYTTVHGPLRILIAPLLDHMDYDDWAQFALLELNAGERR